MAMRLQEIHPSLVHFPISLLPASLLADTAGRLGGNEMLMEVGKRSMPLAALSGLLAGVFGFISQQAVEVDEESAEILATHRNINLAVVGAAFLLARKRRRMKRPSLAYLATGAAALGAVTYSAYLGGHMVYELGVGVEAAGGLREGAAPRLTRENAGEAARLAGRHLEEGIRTAAEEIGRGEFVPYLTGGQKVATTAARA